MQTSRLIGIGVGILGTIACLGPAELVRRPFFDALVRTRPAHALDGPADPIVVVGFDEETSRRLGNAVSRADVGRAIETIADAGAKVIAVDLVSVGPDAASEAVTHAIEKIGPVPPPLAARIDAVHREWDADAVFIAALGRSNVIATFATTDATDGAPAAPPSAKLDAEGCESLRARPVTVVLPNPHITEAIQHSANDALEIDVDGIVRRYPLVYRIGPDLAPSLALQAAALFLDADPIVDCRGESVVDVSLGSYERRNLLDDRGRVRVDFAGSFPESFPHYIPFWKILAHDPFVTADRLKDKLVFIGSRSDLQDRFVVPTNDAGFSGIGVHATVASTLISGQGLVRREMIYRGCEALACLLLGLLVAFAPMQSIPPGLLIGGSLAAPLLGAEISRVMIARGRLIDALTPAVFFSVALLASLAVRYADERRRRLRTERELGKFLSPAVVSAALADPKLLEPRRRVVSVLFSDIRGFTTLAEKMSPEEVAAFLDDHATRMTREVFAQNGMLDKYVGDAMMAVFGAPANDPAHARSACLTALAMRAALEAENAGRAARALSPIVCGVGVVTGEAIVGRMWERGQSAYACIGDTTNAASRLEGLNKYFGTVILVSEKTRVDAGPGFSFRELGPVIVKGRHEPVVVFELLGAGDGPDPAWLASFNRGRLAFAAREWDQAESALRETIAQRGADAVSSAFLVRIERLRREGTAGWSGAFVADEK